MCQVCIHISKNIFFIVYLFRISEKSLYGIGVILFRKWFKISLWNRVLASNISIFNITLQKNKTWKILKCNWNCVSLLGLPLLEPMSNRKDYGRCGQHCPISWYHSWVFGNYCWDHRKYLIKYLNFSISHKKINF